MVNAHMGPSVVPRQTAPMRAPVLLRQPLRLMTFLLASVTGFHVQRPESCVLFPDPSAATRVSARLPSRRAVATTGSLVFKAHKPRLLLGTFGFCLGLHIRCGRWQRHGCCSRRRALRSTSASRRRRRRCQTGRYLPRRRLEEYMMVRHERATILWRLNRKSL